MTLSDTRDAPSLDSWIPAVSGGSEAREAIEEFVQGMTEGPQPVDPSERIAVIDNDGTLWSEKSSYFQKIKCLYSDLGFQPMLKLLQ